MNRSPFRRAQAKLRVALTDTEAEILLYSEISEWWGIGAETFKRELDAITTPTINLRINSPGGDVFDSYAIYNALVAHPARIITHIDGVAASMASIIALAGDEVRMAENAFFMVHNPWSIVMGNADALRKEAGLLEKIGGTMADTYRERTGATAEEVAAWMDDETWFTAEEAASRKTMPPRPLSSTCPCSPTLRPLLRSPCRTRPSETLNMPCATLACPR
jgi:ATP-dependent Clp protease protease subunit